MSKDTHTISYEGDDIYIEEMPNGCFITQVKGRGETVLISSENDALAVIASLRKMLAIQFGEKDDL